MKSKKQITGPGAGQLSNAVDLALEFLQDTSPEYSGGLSNHGSITAETLAALDRCEVILPWIKYYRNRLQALPESRAPIAPGGWQYALGDFGRIRDWVNFFEEELANSDWRDLVGTWVPRLAPGMMGTIFHALIRTAYAVRSVECRTSPQRLRELAHALAYWSARYCPLPGKPGREKGLKADKALTLVPKLPAEMRPRFGLLTKKIMALRDYAPFSEAIGLLDTAGDPGAVISDITGTFAAFYLANARDPKTAITMVHTVTGPASVRLLLPYLDPEKARALAAYAWQGSAAFYSALGGEQGTLKYFEVRESRAGLVGKAVETGDEHAIKFVETCLREYFYNPEPVYLAATRDASERLGEISQFIGKE